MKYLITLPWMPYPATDGGKQGSFNMLNGVAEYDRYNFDLSCIL